MFSSASVRNVLGASNCKFFKQAGPGKIRESEDNCYAAIGDIGSYRVAVNLDFTEKSRID
jgi:hypothetical protein